jgi:drug/metabolite transporter (DMT)-like permease
MDRRLHPSEVALVGVAAVWGLTFVMVQDAIAQLPALAFLAYRFLGAALVVAVVFRGALRALPRAGWLAGARMGLFLTAGYVFQTFGLEHTSAANAGFITGLFVVLTPLFGLLLGQQPSGVVWTAALTAGIGLYLLAGAGAGPHWLGDGLEFLCACAFAAHVHATARSAARYPVGALLAVQLGVCGGVCLLGALATGGMPAPHGLQVWSALLVTSLLASALGFFVQTYAQQHAPPTRTALILTSEPVFAGVSSCLLQGVRLSPTAWLGAALIMAAIVGVELAPRLRAPRPLPEGGDLSPGPST